MEQQSAQVWLNFWDGKITFWLYDLGQQGCISIIYFLG